MLKSLITKNSAGEDRQGQPSVSAQTGTPYGTINFQSLVEGMQVNAVLLDPATWEVVYTNPRCRGTAARISDSLGLGDSDDLIGRTVQLFYGERPAPLDLLGDPDRLPHRERVAVRSEFLDLLFTPVRDADGEISHILLTWHVVTEQQATDERAARLLRMLEDMAVGVLLANAKSCEITYVNQACRQAMAAVGALPDHSDPVGHQLADLLGDPALDTFIRDPGRLPHTALLTFGQDTVKAQLSAITDEAGTVTDIMVVWETVTEHMQLANRVKQVVEVVAQAATGMEETAGILSETASEAAGKSRSAADGVDKATANVETASAAAEELSASINEISRQVNDSSRKAQDAASEAEATNATVSKLAESSARIGDIIKLINDIAGQTNLLALNATIEAARAGDAGKGFAVVASEVKSLANQTAQATEEISAQICEMQAATEQSVKAIDHIRDIIRDLNGISSSIASSVTEQTAATEEIARNMADAAASTRAVAGDVSDVARSADESGQGANQVLNAAEALVKESAALRHEVEAFIARVVH
ncbi:MAG: hypothetical protein D6763_10145 [Alphaproteobacteria bacterium]|nr:MAG: hypothetical protein D6763_10145 [Alphaproteobacteria bacterium]